MNKAFSILTETQIRFLNLLLEESSEFIVVGGFSIRFHGFYRNTSDLDLLVKRSPENANKISAVLSKTKAIKIDKAYKYLQDEWKKIDWKDVDLLTSIHGGAYNTFLSRASKMPLNNHIVYILSRNDLRNERHASLKDEKQSNRKELILKDIEFLKKIK